MAARERFLDGSVGQAPPGPGVPDDHASRAVAGLDLALEAGVVERVVLDRDGEPLLAWIGRRPLRHRPRLQHAADLEAKVEMPRAGGVLLDHEARCARVALAHGSGIPRRARSRLPDVFEEAERPLLEQRRRGFVVGTWTTCPAARSSSANARTPPVRPCA